MICHVLTNAQIVSCNPGASGYHPAPGAIAIENGQIAHVGDVPADFADAPTTDLGGRIVTPGLIDCHTHLVYGGSRAAEFEMRLNGASYEQISRAGGGIKSTVQSTRRATDQQLLDQALRRLDGMIAEGVTTVEVKSGYGLDIDTELRMLRVARQLADARPIRIKTTFLGAHATPADMTADDYLDQVCIPALHQAAAEGLVDAVDGFCENIAFTPHQIGRVFDAARDLNLPVKLHAEQLSNLGGAVLAASRGALSADHLEYLDQAGIDAMAYAGTVAVLLPGAFYTLHETQLPPVQGLRDAHVPMAVATDANPGTSPMTSLLLAMNMAATLFRMTPEECLRGVTAHAARALGLDDCGVIAPGAHADLAVWDIETPAELTYRMGDAPLYARYFKGEPC